MSSFFSPVSKCSSWVLRPIVVCFSHRTSHFLSASTVSSNGAYARRSDTSQGKLRNGRTESHVKMVNPKPSKTNGFFMIFLEVCFPKATPQAIGAVPHCQNVGLQVIPLLISLNDFLQSCLLLKNTAQVSATVQTPKLAT